MSAARRPELTLSGPPDRLLYAHSPTPDSMDLYFQGLAWFNKGMTPDHLGQARGFFDRALSLDPKNVDALVGSAWVDAVDGVVTYATDAMAAFAAAEAKVTKACPRSRTMRVATSKSRPGP